MPTKRKSGGHPHGPGSPRAKKVVAGLLEGKSIKQAGIDAGYSQSYANSKLSTSPTFEWVKKQVARRMKDSMSKAAIHTDAIVGTYVEIMQASIADVLPENEVLARAKENGVDHLIKKLTITPTKYGNKIDLEMYSRMDAANALKDVFGLKQEPRANTYEAERKIEVERSIRHIMDSDKVDRPTAAQRLAAAVGKDSPLLPTINKLASTDAVH
jgi:hypothetical protein